MEHFVTLAPGVAVNPYSVELVYIEDAVVVVRLNSGRGVEVPASHEDGATVEERYQAIVRALSEAKSPAGFVQVTGKKTKAQADATIKHALAGTGHHATIRKTKEN